MNILTTLGRNRVTNALVKTLRINRAVDAYLARFPIKRRTPSGLVYHVGTVPSLIVASDVFSTDVYAGPLALVQPRTFVDLVPTWGIFR